MPNREKVLMGLEAHANVVHPCATRDGKECPYFGGSSVEKMTLCSEQLAKDAHELLLTIVYAHPERLPAPNPNPPPFVIPCGTDEKERNRDAEP